MQNSDDQNVNTLGELKIQQLHINGFLMYVRLYYKKIKLLDESARIDVILKKKMSDYDIHVGSLKFEWRRLLKEVAYRYKASVMKGSDEAC